MANQDSYTDSATGRTVKRGTPINRDNVNKPFQISERINDTATLVPSGNRKTNFIDVIGNILNQNNPMKLYSDALKKNHDTFNNAFNRYYDEVWEPYADAVGNDTPKTLDDIVDTTDMRPKRSSIDEIIGNLVNRKRKPIDKNARPMGQGEYINETMKLS